MNLLLHNVLSDITGESGMKIIRAILAGERDPKVLASYRSMRVKKTEEEIVASLDGYYKPDQLYLLRINYDSYVFLSGKLLEIDEQIEVLLVQFPVKKEEADTCPPQEADGKRMGK